MSGLVLLHHCLQRCQKLSIELLSVSRNLACISYFWSRSVVLKSSVFFDALSTMHPQFGSFLRQHLNLIPFVATTERNLQTALQKTERVWNASWWPFYCRTHPNIRRILQ